MWSSHSDRMFRERVEGHDGNGIPLHNVDETNRAPKNPSGDSSESTTSRKDAGEDGTWGERDQGGPVHLREAMQEFEELRTHMSELSRTRSKATQKSTANSRRARRQSSTRDTKDLEAQERDKEEDEGGAQQDEEEFQLGAFLKEGHFEKRAQGQSAKKVGLVFKNLTVRGVGATSTFVKTLPSAVVGTFGPDLYKILSRFIPGLPAPGSHGEKRDLIHDFTGLVRNGEMMLVLGRPGSGCSTFLKAVTNKRDGFAEVLGEVHYGGISAKEQNAQFRGEVAYNPEDDEHMATLTTGQTLEFSLLNKTKKGEKDDIPVMITALLKMFGISHTRHTLVGDAFVRGISGGERKRVSIAETLATKSTVVAWDNSTRGLDSSTALDYANSLRVMTDISDRTTLVTLYQAGEGIYKLMDKVLVIDEGRMVYQGPAGEAKAYFESLGYYCPDRMTTADFLTACTDPTERRYRDDFEGPIPKGPIELEKAYKESDAFKRVIDQVEQYEREIEESDRQDAKEFIDAVREGKSRTVSKKSNYTVSFVRQVLACTRREFWLTWGDKTTLYTKAFIIVSNGLIVGSLFYGQPLNTEGNFSRGGSLFFSILFLGWLQLAELMKAVSGRSIVARHHDYAFYRPSAVVVARVIQDFPLLFVQVAVFTVIMYFMTGLDVEAGKFFIYMLFVYTTTITITALYRAFAALSPTIDDAVRFSGIGLNLLIIFTGYVIPKPQLVQDYIWFGWIFYINPISYAFEAVLTNEFAGRTLACADAQIVPSGPGYTNPAYQGCAVTGAQLGRLDVSGTTYLATTYQYTRSHLWRNFGVLVAFAVLYILVTAFATEFFNFSAGGGGALEFKKSKKSKNKLKAESAPNDEEKGAVASQSSSNEAALAEQKTREEDALKEISNSESVFTWENVEYTVPYLGGEKKLLNKINGYAKPGLMVALMGASGAGKTTLLNTLAQRQKTGIVRGDMLVDGRPLDIAFQRGTGFCEQMDLHDGTATIREALEFSALLRQDADTPKAEKLAYVDKIVDLLELGDMQDALIRCLGVEQKKRVTIGVELAAKPSLLLFLDEPTSGLDSQSAYSIVRFLRKLSGAGQAIICTIHQPSSILIQQFDMILALNPGGNTFYFGPVGDNGIAVIKYFADRGVQCPPNKNVAEFILETAAKGGKREDGKRLNWNDEWLNSKEAKEVIDDIARIKSERSKVSTDSNVTPRAFAAPVGLQTIELTKRVFRQHWRDPSYYYGKLFTSVIIGIFNGFTFWQLGTSTTDLQDRLFSCFLILVIPPTIVNAVLPKFYQNRALWEAREYPSRIYGWFAFCTAQIVTEIPIAIIGALIYWVLWYYPAGLPTDSSTAGYVFLMSMLFFLFQASWGQWICAFAPSFSVISNVLPFFFVVFSLFNGVVRPYSQLPPFWRYWLYYLNPSTYWIGGVLAATLRDIRVQCTYAEAAHFNPPPGQTCQDYAGAFAASTPGYLTNPSAMRDCGYCQYSTGVDYLHTLNLEPSDKWKYFGIFMAFVCSNWGLVYFFIWSVRVRGWTFGFGPLFGGLGMAVNGVKGLFSSGKGKKDGEKGEE